MLGKAGNISISIPCPGQFLRSAYGGMWWNGSWAPASAVLLSTCGHILDAFLACSTPGWGLGQNHNCSHWELWACFLPAFCFGSCFWPFYAEHTYLFLVLFFWELRHDSAQVSVLIGEFTDEGIMVSNLPMLLQQGWPVPGWTFSAMSNQPCSQALWICSCKTIEIFCI